MDLTRWPDADALIDQALDLAPAEREQFIRRLRQRDAALGEAIAAVVGEAQAADAFLAPGAALSGPLALDLSRQPEPDVASRLSPGDRVGCYEVLALEGRGGMGEVYKARDTRLGRLVALKVLPDRFARDPARLARFEREARLLATFSHPRIGAIYGLAEDGAMHVLVLEWIEGVTLVERLARGPVPPGEAIGIAIAIAEALEAAHERGIVHRDLKPGNVKLSADGVKVLDFGLAKAVVADEPRPPGDVSTLLEYPGMVIGTAAYMSPEQARGSRVDHRADIWAFGCVLAEMLSGQRVFSGSSSHAILAAVLEREPDLAALPADTPPALRRLIVRCLEKDPRRRLGWIGEAVLALEEARGGGPAPGPVAVEPRSRWRRAWPVIGALSVGALAAGIVVPRLQAPPPPPVMRLAVPVPRGDQLVAGDLPTVAISPDGRQVIYRARREGAVQLFHRALDREDPVAVAGSEYAMGPFLSPDGRWVGFSRDEVLVKAPLGGGAPVEICRTSGAVASAWGADGTIVFGGELTRGLQRVDASGGSPVAVTTLDDSRGEIAHGAPEWLPAQAGVLFTVWFRDDEPSIAISRLDGAPHRILLNDGRQPRVLAAGLLAFVRQNALWAVPFDARRLSVGEAPAPVTEGVDTSVVSGTAHFAVSDSGTLVFLAQRTARARAREVLWVDRDGRERREALAPGPFTRAAVSADGQRIALATTGPDSRDLWMWRSDRGTLTRLTFDDSLDTAPVWTPDGADLLYRSDRSPRGIYRVRADGAGSPVQVTSSGDAIHTPYDLTRDGRHVLFTEFRTYRDQDVGMAPADGTGPVEWLLDGPFAEVRPRLSQDGRWIAYQSDESGRFEVYVRPFPAVKSGRWQVSTGGGTTPIWGPHTRELFYFQDGTIVRVPVSTAATFQAGTPERLFSIDVPSDRLGPLYDLHPDGQRFLFLRPVDRAGEDAAGQLLFVEHWAQDAHARWTSARPAAR